MPSGRSYCPRKLNHHRFDDLIQSSTFPPEDDPWLPLGRFCFRSLRSTLSSSPVLTKHPLSSSMVEFTRKTSSRSSKESAADPLPKSFHSYPAWDWVGRSVGRNGQEWGSFSVRIICIKFYADAKSGVPLSAGEIFPLVRVRAFATYSPLRYLVCKMCMVD